MADAFSWIKEAAEDFNPLFLRMDRDRDLYNMVEYHLKDLEEPFKPAKDVVNITLNDPKVFADRASAFMNEAGMQVVIEGRHLQDRDSTLIENFDTDIRYEIDRQLVMKDIDSLYSFLIEQSIIRGTLGARYVSWDDAGKFSPDLLPCDSRFLVYEYGRKDLVQAAFKTVRSKTAILDEYPNAKIEGTSKKGGIWEHWGKDKGEIWLSSPFDAMVSGQKLDEKENVFGYVPFIIQGVGAGTMLQDEGSIEHRFESIFASNRLLYEHLNMLGSILQTLNYMTFNRAHLWESDAGTMAKVPPKPGMRKTIPIDKGTRGLFPVEITDITQSTRLFYALILGAVQKGSLPNIDYGNLTFPLSAVAISKLTATKDAIFSPRLQAIAWFYRKLHLMIKDQYIKGGYQAELGEEGVERTYSASDLDKNYKIGYKFHPVSPEQDIANYAVAAQALAVGMSKHTVFTNILKLQNPDGEIMKSRAEKAEQLDPAIGLFRYGHALIDQGNDQSFLESELVADQIERILRQRYAMPELPIEPSESTGRAPSPKSMIPLMGGGTGAPPEDMSEMEPEQMLQKVERRGETVRKSEVEG